MAGIIDADTHISEGEAMWAMMDKEMYHRRPVLVKSSEDTLYCPRNAFWLIDANIFDNPYFNPIYQTASDADLPVLIHTGAGCPLFLSLFDVERNHTFGHSRVQPLFAFRDLIANKIPEQFPKLRFGFIEASAGWVPFMMHILKRLFREKWKFSSDKDMFREYRIFVACEADEDVNYIAQFTGEDHLLIGSDYGHQDPSEERQRAAAMRVRDDVPRALTDKIFFDNPRQFYPI